MTTSQKSMQDSWKNSYLSENDSYLESLYEDFLKSPDAVSPEWREYFSKLQNDAGISHYDIQNYFRELAKQPKVAEGGDLLHEHQQEKIIELISAYRNLGHLQADIDPLGLYRGFDNP